MLSLPLASLDSMALKRVGQHRKKVTGHIMFRVIFACVHNAGRSQMAAAFFNHLADPQKAQAISAGTEPGARVHPEVHAVMQELGIDLSDARPQKLTDKLAQGAQLLITMGCGDQCPYVPGLKTDDWPIRDPKGLLPDEVRAIRDEIKERVQSLVGGLSSKQGDSGLA
jgi:arsenate reductase (thioredoxin)